MGEIFCCVLCGCSLQWRVFAFVPISSFDSDEKRSTIFPQLLAMDGNGSTGNKKVKNPDQKRQNIDEITFSYSNRRTNGTKQFFLKIYI